MYMPLETAVTQRKKKLGAHAANHAKTVAWNIWRDMEGKEKQPYSQAFSGILVTLGRIGGAGIIFGWQIPSFIVGVIKSRSLFTSKYWDLMGQKNAVLIFISNCKVLN